ncbi:MAG: GTPase HflX [Pseudomonadales bacterium]|nr:GTPase HflX [Pseudomonadales bacterium]
MFVDRPEAGKKALLLNVEFRQARARQEQADVDELRELCRALDLEICDVVSARRDVPHPRWYVGEGKVDEIRAQAQASGADLLVVNHELSPGQQRNLEKSLDMAVLTRTEVILHIFSARARTHEGKLQVELAQLKHAQSRLVRGWTHLDRQKGGIGMRGGVGETQIELDQRMLAMRIKSTRARLEEVAQRRAQSRRRRQRNQIPSISLVGYTNAGKSTLFNKLTAADAFVQDQVFATLDPTMRRLLIPGAGECILADTVGFISHLPHGLVEAFKSTLEEVAEADLLLHVVDASDPQATEKIDAVNGVLAEIGARDVPTLLVWNKIDRLAGAPPESGVAVSAVSGQGLPALIDGIARVLGVRKPAVRILLSPEDGQTRAWLYSQGAVQSEETLEDGGTALVVLADDQLLGRLRQLHRGLLDESIALPARDRTAAVGNS